MKCPIHGEVLVIAERQGVEIDYCPQCRGVWLDRGELEKIIDRSVGAAPPAERGSGHRDGGYRDDGYRDGGYRDERHRKKRKESFLSELFDF